MSETTMVASLPPERRHLLTLMQRINYGRIESLVIQRGQPVLDPLPRTVREVKFGGHRTPRPKTPIEDFALKSQVVELFRYFDGMEDGVVETIEVKDGLPFRMAVEDAA